MMRSFLVLFSVFCLVLGDESIVIYDGVTGELENAFQDWSWATVNLKDQAYVAPGDQFSWSFVVQDYQALYIDGSFGAFHTLSHLAFLVNGGKNGSQPVHLSILNDRGVVGNSVDLEDYLPDKVLTANEWQTVSVPFKDFDQQGAIEKDSRIRGVWFQASTPDNAGTVYLDDINFSVLGDASMATIKIDKSIQKTVSPLIFGVNLGDDTELIASNKYTLNRRGGNEASRYNWQTSSSNQGQDWYFENVVDSIQTSNGSSADDFINTTLNAGAQPVLTFPTIGFVSKNRDPTVCGFSVAKYGEQQSENNGCGNGIFPNGSYVTNNDPADTSIVATPDSNLDWLSHLLETFGLDVTQNLIADLDNEPSLWSVLFSYSCNMHRDIHPSLVGYDEIWNRTVEYALPIKQQPNFSPVQLMGPVLGDWCSFMFSGIDGCRDGPDREAHGDLPQLEWFIKQLGEYENQTGIRLIDIIDIHFFPQELNVVSSQEDPETIALRLQSTRSLWDPSYIDQSWINEPIYILPRVQYWIDQYSPGLKISVSEYSWGFDDIATAAVADAEVLAIFAREGVSVGAKWQIPTSGSWAEESFAIFLNYDGNGSSVPLTSIGAFSNDVDFLPAYSFAGEKGNYVLLINKNPTTRDVQVDLSDDLSGQVDTYSFCPDHRLSQTNSGSYQQGKYQTTLEAYSASLLVFQNN